MASFKDFLKNKHDAAQKAAKIRSRYIDLLTTLNLVPHENEDESMIWYMPQIHLHDHSARVNLLQKVLSALTKRLGQPKAFQAKVVMVDGLYEWKAPEYSLSLQYELTEDGRQEMYFNLIDKVNI